MNDTDAVAFDLADMPPGELGMLMWFAITQATVHLAGSPVSPRFPPTKDHTPSGRRILLGAG
ncbi:MAG: hypothetical protein ACKV22_01035 [Bryobacteraceae bacterium]